MKICFSNEYTELLLEVCGNKVLMRGLRCAKKTMLIQKRHYRIALYSS